MKLSTPIADAGRLFANYAKRLEKLEIFTLNDFLYHLPTRYEDFSKITSILDATAGEIVTIHGEIVSVQNSFTKRFKQIQRATITDGSGTLSVMWFNQPYIAKTLKFGDKIALSGRIESDNGIPTMISPDFEIIPFNGRTIHTGRLVPIYPETQGVSSKWLRRQVEKILTGNTDELGEFLPEDVRSRQEIPDLLTALQTIHFPDSLEQAELARKRLGFDEVFLLQLANVKRKAQWQQQVKGHIFGIEKFAKEIDLFWEKLPFTPTNAQRRAIGEISTDLASSHAMNRLLEGDVGSGKTVVAAFAMYLSFLNGFQSVLMAPTEILANQHYQTISKLLEPLGVKVELQTGTHKGKGGSVKGKELPNILIGTHAVLSGSVQFDRLGLIVIDEQHRFGVEQRSILRQKGENPHVLTMTATPIPRTVALTLYGDLELSLLDEMPKGRKYIKTWLVPQQKRESGYKWIQEQVRKGDQVFIVCPFIEESETLTTIKAATTEFERLQKQVFPKLKLGLLHGKMRAKEKDAILEEFRKGQIDILIATPVVEVGIDIPNATIILIEAAERFGLSQLHQLRGRVGRGDKQSYCLLFTQGQSIDTFNRLKSLEKIHNGAELAELDLKIRGAGELYGTMQHGRTWLKIASFSDTGLIEKAKQEALRLFSSLSNYPLLEQKVEEVSQKQVSPD